MATIYTYAPDVAEIAAKLIAEHHDHLDGVRIEYVFRDEHATAGGKAIWGKARKISGLNAYLANIAEYDQSGDGEGPDPFFVIEIAFDIWQALKENERVALVDHELCHCLTETDDDGAMKLLIVGHDVEAFQAEVKRHGIWRREIKDLVAAADDHEQLSLLNTPAPAR